MPRRAIAEHSRHGWRLTGEEAATLNENELLSRIVVNPRVRVGKPVINSMRLSVEIISGLLAHGMTIDGIVDEYVVAREDVLACLLFASRTLEDVTDMPIVVDLPS